MRKLFGFIGTFIGSTIGWWLGAFVGTMTAFLLGVIGAGAGLAIAVRLARRYE
jgi:F0F1-type ATP synthase assembly protein I